MYKTYVNVKVEIEGLHAWAGIPNTKELADVQFLQFPHRHTFVIQAKKEVKHEDRDIEIILMQREIKRYLHGRYMNLSHRCIDFGSMSCEMIASELVAYFGLDSCTVLEDNENGGTVERDRVQWDELTSSPVVFVCGWPCSGKDHFIKTNLSNHKAISVSSIVKELTNTTDTRKLNNTKDLDISITKELKKKINSALERGEKVAIDGIRQLSILQGLYCNHYQIAWLDVPYYEREARFELRNREEDLSVSYSDVSDLNIGLGMKDLQNYLLKNPGPKVRVSTKIIKNY